MIHATDENITRLMHSLYAINEHWQVIIQTDHDVISMGLFADTGLSTDPRNEMSIASLLIARHICADLNLAPARVFQTPIRVYPQQGSVFRKEELKGLLWVHHSIRAVLRMAKELAAKAEPIPEEEDTL